MENKPKTIDDYITGKDPSVQPYLKEVAEIIRAAIPMAKEKIAWGMPSFWDYKYIIHMDAYKDHVNVYVGDFLVNKYKASAPDYKWTTRGIQLYYDQPIPKELIAQMAKESHQREMERKNADQREKRR